MNKTTLTVLLSFVTITALAQQDVANIQLARKELDVSRKCDEAMRLLNLVPTDSRQGNDYLLCMGRTQDCMQNSEQALYYYNKLLAQQPANDSVKKRVAELTDLKNRRQRVSGEENKAKAIYGAASHSRKHRRAILTDNYYSLGLDCGFGLSADRSPYKNAVHTHLSDGFIVFKDHALVGLDFNSGFLVSPNKTWFKKALDPISPGLPLNSHIGIGFSPSLTLGMSAILVNNKDIALTAGIAVGAQYYSYPSNIVDYSSVDIDSRFMLCYGPVANLYVGDYFIFFTNLILSSVKSADVSTGLLSYQVPVSYSMLNVGVALKVDGWFW